MTQNISNKDRRVAARPPRSEYDRLKRWWDQDYIRRPENALLKRSDEKCYVSSPDANIFQGLSPELRAQFGAGDGGELKLRANGTIRMAALHSSAALAVNVFQHWLSQDDRSPLQSALGLASPIESLTFEKKFPNGVSGIDPNLDLAITLRDGTVVAIESKYTEPFRGKDPGLKGGYFKNDVARWADLGLLRHQMLAETMRPGLSSGYKHLTASQLLKHTLGMAHTAANDPQRPPATKLYYLYVAFDGPKGDLHREEIARYAAAVAGDPIEFEALSYQQLLERLINACSGLPAHAEYLAYLEDRYFSIQPTG